MKTDYKEERVEREQEPVSEEYGDVIDTYEAPSGECYSLYCKLQGDVRTFSVVNQSQDGKTQEHISLQLEEGIYYRFIFVDAQGNILLADSTTLYVFEQETGSCLHNVQVWAQGGVLMSGSDMVICQTYKDSPYYIFESGTGENKGIYLEEEFLFEKRRMSALFV